MKKAKVLGVIPARLHSSRLKKKMLADIWSKSLICRTYEQAKKAVLLDEVVVATDADVIAQNVEKCGGQAILTSPAHQSGTERVAEVAKSNNAEIILNIQGDEPLISPEAIDAVIEVLLSDKSIQMATVATPLKASNKLLEPSIVKVVLDKNNFAIYFSRSIIPHPRQPYAGYLRHLGVYGFRRDFLLRYVRLEPTSLELAESLEQLRALENGYKIKVVVGNFESISVDTLADLQEVREKVKPLAQQAARPRLSGVPLWRGHHR